MSINFFSKNCKTSSSMELFGLCDDPPPVKNPAYIDEGNQLIWIAKVYNSNELKINFYAIDHCPSAASYRPNLELEQRCDGMLYFENKIIFVELKNRGHGKWLADGMDQLIASINVFITNNINSPYQMEAHVSNKMAYQNNASYRREAIWFKEQTSIILRVSPQIIIN